MEKVYRFTGKEVANLLGQTVARIYGEEVSGVQVKIDTGGNLDPTINCYEVICNADKSKDLVQCQCGKADCNHQQASVGSEGSAPSPNVSESGEQVAQPDVPGYPIGNDPTREIGCNACGYYSQIKDWAKHDFCCPNCHQPVATVGHANNMPFEWLVVAVNRLIAEYNLPGTVNRYRIDALDHRIADLNRAIDKHETKKHEQVEPVEPEKPWWETTAVEDMTMAQRVDAHNLVEKEMERVFIQGSKDRYQELQRLFKKIKRGIGISGQL